MTYINKRIVIHSDFDSVSGYGNLATELAINLEKSGAFDVYTIGTIGFGLPRELTKIFEKPKPPKFEIYLKIGTPQQLEPPDSLKAGFNFKKIALTMWEQTRLTKDLAKKTYYDFYDAIFVPCEMNVEVFKEVFTGPVEVIPIGVDTDFFTAKKRIFGDPLKFCMIGDLNYRKNVMSAIKATQKVLETGFDIRLNLKTGNNCLPNLIPDSRINIINTVMWDKEKVRNFYYDNDVYLAISRGEGINMPALEFLATGGTVIGHNWGGHKSWFNELYCTKVLSHNRIKISPNIWAGVQENSEWAEVSVDSIAVRMIEVIEQRKILFEKSAKAIEFIDQLYGWRNQMRRIITLLEGV